MRKLQIYVVTKKSAASHYYDLTQQIQTTPSIILTTVHGVAVHISPSVSNMPILFPINLSPFPAAKNAVRKGLFSLNQQQLPYP